jgi:hypothetical protein
MSRTVRFAFCFALPFCVVAPIALGACHGSPAVGTSGETNPIIDPPPIMPAEEPVYVPATPPPPISGGTLIALTDGVTAVAADPDRDSVWIVDTVNLKVRGSIALQPGDEPGRGVEDGAGRVWVALRRGGAVVALDIATMKVAERVPVCAEPRGIVHDPASDQIHIACASGELVTLAAKTGAEVRRLRLDRDLRDVLLDGKGLRVSRFRSAELLSIGADGTLATREKPPGYVGISERKFEAAVAWRTVALPGGGVAILHQRDLSTSVPSFAGAYYIDPCAVIVHTAVTVAQPGAPQSPQAGGLNVALAVDLAVAPDGKSVAVAAAGDRVVVETTLESLATTDSTLDCANQGPGASAPKSTPYPATPIAVAYDPAGRLLVQSREPPSVWVVGVGEIPLPGVTRRDSGHEMFHAAPSAGIACASCHPEGREDGHVWTFDEIGVRRTQSVAGGVLDSGALHWAADLPDFDALLDEVFVTRMQRAKPGPLHTKAFSRWLDALPAARPSTPIDATAVAKGDKLFHDASIGCTTCHVGPRLTTGQTADVGTGAKFKIPSLVGVAARAPFMHDGCAATLADRFGAACGGAAHGSTAGLTPDQVSDLVAYMETL